MADRPECHVVPTTADLTSDDEVGHDGPLLRAAAAVPDGSMGVAATAVSLAQNIMGSGLLALPYAFRSGGIAGAGILLGAVLLLSVFSMGLLPALSDQFSVFTFKEVAVLAGSQRAGDVMEAFVLLYNMGICIGYCVFVGDFVSTLVGDHLGGYDLSARVASVAVTVVVFWPLSCAKSLGGLAPLTIVGVVGILFTTAVTVMRYADGHYANHRNPAWPVHMSGFDFSHIGNTFPILVVAFGAHFNILNFYKELKDRSQRRMSVVICVALLIATAVYGTAGIFVYATFGHCTESDFTKNFDSGDVWVSVVRGTMLFALCVSFPLVLLSARSSVDTLLLVPRGLELTTARRVGLSTLLTAAALGIAVAAGDPGPVLDYNGSVFGTPVCYVAPPALYLMLPRKQQSASLRYGSIVCAAVGVVFAVLGVVEVTLEQVKGDDGGC
eukprot:TRINITY_DN2353_c0_g1_i4.p1 TRINITY_DN2353_c0_g1~~TRINITY_DN2353_c0_g1_i4.p1  ORF type:complete len:440 (+),score=191.74 TRINITY_DN2353_c0_g1_i4:86-1405(+)